MDVADASDSRLADLTQWVQVDLGFAASSIVPASADASFRRYFRLTRDTDTYILMDAPPAKEDLAPFLQVAKILAGLDLNVPLVLARDVRRGFLLLTDLGSRQYLEELDAPDAAEALYADALQALQKIQLAESQVARDLPRYDRTLLMREMDLMPEWFLGKHLGVRLDAAERGVLSGLFETLVEAAALQPQVLVHRDYHSRNLLLCPASNPGILDFQDAVWGPITYDLASLLKDCYIAWPKPRVRAWVLQYRERLLKCGFALHADAAQFIRWFDLIGLQRHIKVLGIFARLYYRDGKSQYLKDLPRVLQYVKETSGDYPELAQFADFLVERIDPYFNSAQQRALG